MTQVDAGGILDIAMAGTSATLLARKWESALLVNVDNDTLKKIMANQEAMAAIMKIEGFRALGSDVFETVVNKSEKVKATKKAKGTVTPTAATCRAQRAIHLGKRRGHCSNRPKTSTSARPTPYTRATSCHSFASQPKLNSKVNNAQSMATVRTRRQPNRARQFEGGASALSRAKGLEVILSGC